MLANRGVIWLRVTKTQRSSAGYLDQACVEETTWGRPKSVKINLRGDEPPAGRISRAFPVNHEGSASPRGQRPQLQHDGKAQHLLVVDASHERSFHVLCFEGWGQKSEPPPPHHFSFSMRAKLLPGPVGDFETTSIERCLKGPTHPTRRQIP